MSPNLEAPTSIAVPSADLINYRFDQTDERFKEMNTKLDAILTQNSHFITEDRTAKMIKEAVDPINTTLLTYRWWYRTLLATVMLAFLTALFGLIHGTKF
jgi:hypothetical protein